MKTTIDISLYPLSDNYREIIVAFVLALREQDGLQVDTDGMRTQITGDYDRIMEVLRGEMKSILENGKAVFVLKLAAGERTRENLTEALR